MVNIETHEIVDMIPSRSIEEVANWLKQYPNIEIVSRDGSVSYKKAIRQALPDAEQISDRFHLIKNFADSCRIFLSSYLQPRVILNKTSVSEVIDNDESMAVLADLARSKYLTLKERFEGVLKLIAGGQTKSNSCKHFCLDIRVFKRLYKMTANEREDRFAGQALKKHDLAAKRKQQKIDAVKKLAAADFTKTKIANELGLDFKTVAKYLKINGSWSGVLFGNKKESILDYFVQDIETGICGGLNGRQIYELIHKKGFSGSSRSLRFYIAAWKKRHRHEILADFKGQKIEWIDRKSLLKLCYKPLEEIKSINQEILTKVCNRYPVFEKIYNLITSFKSMIRQKACHKLEQWLEDLQNSEISDIQNFARGVRRDFDAVKNGIAKPFNNGLAEGFINKLKVIKRIMYGRSNFNTLKLKSLLIQKWF